MYGYDHGTLAKTRAAMEQAFGKLMTKKVDYHGPINGNVTDEMHLKEQAARMALVAEGQRKREDEGHRARQPSLKSP
ncbi:Fc.00g015510.m01.CDS01 [Cosmosporella sp. VM-42]